MNYKKTLLIFVLLLFPLMVSARYDVFDPACTNNEKLNLRNQIPRISFITERYLEEEKSLYKVEIIGISTLIDIEDLDTGIIYKPQEAIEVTNIKPGIIKRFTLVANSTSVCEGYRIYTKNIVIPHYNMYSEHELCKNNKDFILCSETYPSSITEEYFLRSINQHIEQKNKELEEEKNIIPNEKNINFLQKVIKFLGDYYLYLLIITIVISISGITIIKVKNRRNIL